MRRLTFPGLSKKRGPQLVLALFFAVCVIAPIARMFLRITPEALGELARSPQFGEAVRNSLATSAVATVFSGGLAFACALCLERSAMGGKALFRTVFLIPMLIPSISHAFGLVAIFGANGAVTRLLGLDAGIYGFWGIVAGSVMYSFPVALVMFTGILQYEDARPYQAARVLGIGPFHQFVGITLPYLRRTIISVCFAVFTMVVTDYGVPLMIGGRCITLSVLMYNKAVGMMDYGTGSAIGAILLIPAVAAFAVDLLNPDNASSAYVTERVVPERRPPRDAAALIFCALTGLFILLPLIAFAVMVFETRYPADPTPTLYHIEKTLNRGAGTYLGNSVLYALLTALIGTAAAFGCAYLTARVRGRFSRALHLMSIVSMAVPGIVLGLSYVIFFSATPIYGTVLIVLLANTIHFFSSPYLMMYNTLSKINANLESVGLCLGVSRVRLVWDVILPRVRSTLWEMFSYFFVNAMMTISAVSFLAPPSPKPVALMINQFEAQLLMESAAFVSLLILAVNLAVKLVVSRLSVDNHDRS